MGVTHDNGGITKRLRLSETNGSSTEVIVDVFATGNLPRCKLFHALIVRVIHVVEDTVEAWLRAAVRATGSWASTCGVPLSGSVVDEISWTAAACTTALEYVEESQPVTYFVDGGQTHLVVGRTSVGERACEVDAAVEGSGQLGQACGWEVACNLVSESE